MTTDFTARHFAIIGSRGYPSTYGGFETFVREFAPYLAQHGARVTVYSHSAESEHTFQGSGVIRVVRTPGLSGRSTATLTRGLSASLATAWSQPDAALVLNVANGFWLPFLRRRRVPTAVNVDGIEWERDKWGRMGRRVFRSGAGMTARWADLLIADSRAIGDYWQKEFGREATFIPYGAHVQDEDTDADAKILDLGLKPGSYVLAVARLVPENNVDLLLDAMARLRGKYQTVVVGSAQGRSPIEQRLTDLNRTKAARVRWLGHVHDQELLQQLWQHSGVYAHGHSVGGTNPALLQAMAAGAPTIALDTVYNREVLGPGWPTYERDSRDLARLIDEILQSDVRRDELREWGRRRIRDEYSWSSVCRDYARVLNDLAHGAHR